MTTILIKINPLKVDIKLTLFMGVQLRTLCHAASCCYARLYDFQRAVTRASLACFWDEPTVRRFSTPCGPLEQ